MYKQLIFLMISPKNRTVYNFRGDLIRDICSLEYEVHVTGPDRMDVDRIEELGAIFHEVPLHKTGTGILHDIRYCVRLFRLMRRIKPDVSLGYTVKPVIYGAIAGKLAGVRNICSMITGCGYTFTSLSLKARFLGLIVRLLYRMGLACSSRVIFQNTDDLKEFTQRNLVRKDKCAVVAGSGVNTERFKVMPFPDRMTFFMLSRLLYSKGVIEYLSAAWIVKSRYPDARFVLLGRFEQAMHDAVSCEEVEPYIRDGIVERFEETADPRSYYADCSVYVLPSYREGTPRTVLEAMAAGRPVITTDTNGCRDTVIDGANGFLVPARNAQAVADKMIWMIEHPRDIERMGKKSRMIAKIKYDVRKVNRQMLKAMGLDKR